MAQDDEHVTYITDLCQEMRLHFKQGGQSRTPSDGRDGRGGLSGQPKAGEEGQRGAGGVRTEALEQELE